MINKYTFEFTVEEHAEGLQVKYKGHTPSTPDKDHVILAASKDNLYHKDIGEALLTISYFINAIHKDITKESN